MGRGTLRTPDGSGEDKTLRGKGEGVNLRCEYKLCLSDERMYVCEQSQTSCHSHDGFHCQHAHPHRRSVGCNQIVCGKAYRRDVPLRCVALTVPKVRLRDRAHKWFDGAMERLMDWDKTEEGRG